MKKQRKVNQNTLTGKIRKEIIPRGKRKPRELMPERKEQEKFIVQNISKAKNKIAYLKKKGYYKASLIAQQSMAQLKFLNRKYGFSDTTFFTGNSFKGKVKSGGDMNILYRVVRDILDIDTRFVHKKYDEIKEDFNDIGIDFEKNFDALSYLSSEYHEVFAFLSYNEVSDIVGSGDGDIASKLFGVIERMHDKYISTDKQEEAYSRLKIKLGSNREISSRQLDNILNGDD